MYILRGPGRIKFTWYIVLFTTEPALTVIISGEIVAKQLQFVSVLKQNLGGQNFEDSCVMVTGVM